MTPSSRFLELLHQSAHTPSLTHTHTHSLKQNSKTTLTSWDVTIVRNIFHIHQRFLRNFFLPLFYENNNEIICDTQKINYVLYFEYYSRSKLTIVGVVSPSPVEMNVMIYNNSCIHIH